jgi:transposase InsO family protein
MAGWRVPLREATPYGQAPNYLIRDNDSKFGSCFTRVATTSAIEILKTPYHAKRSNAICERFLRSVRQECLDHLLILQEKQFQRVLTAYVAYFNQARPQEAHSAAASRLLWIISFHPARRNQGGCRSDLGWAAP